MSLEDFFYLRRQKTTQVSAARNAGILDRTREPSCSAPMMSITSYCKPFDANRAN